MSGGRASEVMQVGSWRVEPALDTISRGQEVTKLEPRTMRLLLYLASSPGAVVSVERLLADVWSGVVVGPASVYQAVSQLRKLLGDVDPEPTYIVNVPRKGYRLIAPVKQTAHTSPGMQDVEAVPAPQTAPMPAMAAPSPIPSRSLTLTLLAATVLVLVLAGGWVLRRTAPSDQPMGGMTTNVVLPFIDMTTEKADQAFCDGLTEELSNWLAQIPSLRVVARTSAFAFRGQGEDVRQIGATLNTNHILEGSVRRSGDHLRITVQLIDARNGYHLWSANFDRPAGDAINLQEDISRSVAGTLQVRLSSDNERQFLAWRSADPQAYQLYLRGRHYAEQMTADSTDRAVDLFKQVLTADPKFAPAYTQLAYARLNQGYFHDLPVAEVSAQMEPLIASALRLDGRMSSAYAVRGALRALQSRMKDSLDDLHVAVSLNPSDMGAWAESGRIQISFGQPREALKSYDRAIALDPLNFTLHQQRCKALTDLAEYQEAESACERARVLQPDSATPLDGLAWLAESRGRIDDALRWSDMSIKAEPREDFDHYWEKSTFFLVLGLTGPAREAVEAGRRATNEDGDADTALVRVIYREQGLEGLRDHLSAARLEQSTHALALFEAAYGHLLLGDALATKELIARAISAPDRIPGFAERPFYARGANNVGSSYRLDLAVADLMLGDRASAETLLQSVLAMLNQMIASGVERNATYELRAEVYALEGRGDEAMQDLRTAAKLGWRRVWWAMHEPYLASLRSRSDFQALIQELSRSNEDLSRKILAQT